MASSVKVRLPDIAAKGRTLQDQAEFIADQQINLALGEISTRTAAGIDVDGSPFTEYSDQYKAELIDNRESTDVDLSRTGTMLRSMTARVEKIPNGVAGVLFFISGRAEPGDSNAEIARKHNEGDYGGSRPKPRKFFALSEKQIREIISNVRKGIRL